VTDRESHWAGLMRAANGGDARSYHRLLQELAPVLRGLASRGLARHRLGSEDVEDVVQETLLALHLKRGTWDESQAFSPWLYAIARNKLIDNLRRRGRQAHVPIDDIGELRAGDLQPGETPAEINGVDAERMIAKLRGREREIVVAISIEGASARQVAERLGMTEGAVRVALHRALRSLAKVYRTP
jgi:RNA polymerase sigma factor (sigma-70 family)